MKEIWFNNQTYTVPNNVVKHLHNVDVAEIDNDLIVYYCDENQCWKQATNEMKISYTNKIEVNVVDGQDILNAKSCVEDLIEILDTKVTKIQVEMLVGFNKQKNVWEFLDKKSETYKLYKLFEFNKGKLNLENKVINGSV